MELLYCQRGLHGESFWKNNDVPYKSNWGGSFSIMWMHAILDLFNIFRLNECSDMGEDGGKGTCLQNDYLVYRSFESWIL